MATTPTTTLSSGAAARLIEGMTSRRAKRNARVDLAARITAARSVAAIAEVARRTAELGSSHPATLAYAARSNKLAATMTSFAALAEFVAIPRLTAPPGCAIVHGRVLAAETGLGFDDVTVALVLPWGEVKTYMCTDERGYFRFDLDDFEGGNPPANLELRLQVSNEERRRLYLDSESFVLEDTSVVYRTIRLTTVDGKPCPEPPEGTILEPMPVVEQPALVVADATCQDPVLVVENPILQ